MKQAFKEFLDRLVAHYQQTTGELPKQPDDSDVEAFFWQGPPDDSEWRPWRPIEKTEKVDFAALLGLGPLHPSIDEYLNSYWFGIADGALGKRGFTLDAVLPGLWPESAVEAMRSHAEDHGGKLESVPIGTSRGTSWLVVDNRTGEVGVEDIESHSVEPVAPSLADFFKALTPG